MKIFITGAAGFIGSHLVEYYLKKGDVVCGIDDLSTGNINNLEDFIPDKNFKFIRDDIMTWPEIDDFMDWPDRIYHMAAVVGVYKVIEEPERVLEVNIAGTERLLRAVKNARRQIQVLLASSAEVYGPSNQLPLSESDNIIVEIAAKNRFNYAISKLADEALGISYHQNYQIKIVMARLFNTIGPRQTGQYGMVVPNFVEQARLNKPVTVFGDGQQTRSFCDVRDSVRMMDLILSNENSAGNVLNLGNNREISINQLAELVISTVQSKSIISHISYQEAYGKNYIDIQRRRPALDKLFGLINYKHQWQLEDTIREISNHKAKKSKWKTQANI